MRGNANAALYYVVLNKKKERGCLISFFLHINMAHNCTFASFLLLLMLPGKGATNANVLKQTIQHSLNFL